MDKKKWREEDRRGERKMRKGKERRRQQENTGGRGVITCVRRRSPLVCRF